MINLKSISFKNFGSFGNTPTVIDLTKRRMNLVSGINGQGKSFALLDTITFALYGKLVSEDQHSAIGKLVNEKIVKSRLSLPQRVEHTKLFVDLHQNDLRCMKMVNLSIKIQQSKIIRRDLKIKSYT